MVGFYLLRSLAGLEGKLFLNAFQSIYHPVKARNEVNPQNGYYYLSPRTRLCPKFLITPNKMHNLKESFSLTQEN